MKLTVQTSALQRVKADAVALFVIEDKETFKQQLLNIRKLLGSRLDRIVELEKFKGKDGEIVTLFTDHKLSSPRLFLIGMGESKKLSHERYRRAAATAAKKA